MIITNETIKKHIELTNKLQNNIKEFYEITNELSKERYKLSNVYADFWREILSKYKEEDLFDAHGDIFYVKEKVADVIYGNRVLWNLELSKELYAIVPEVQKNSDGEYDGTEYDITVIE